MKWWTVVGLDVAWVLIFAAIGRLSHGEGADPAGVIATAWPFLVGLIGTTIILLGLKRPPHQVFNGAIGWLGTLGFGMWIRARTGDGVQPSFVIVAGIFLIVGMLGWRLIAARRRARSGTH